MSERTTPETDAAWQPGFNEVHRYMNSRRLELQRDEEREKYFAMRELCNNATDLAEKYKQERDEAREKLCKVLQILDDYDQALKNPSSPFWEAFKKWFTREAAK